MITYKPYTSISGPSILFSQQLKAGKLITMT